MPYLRRLLLAAEYSATANIESSIHPRKYIHLVSENGTFASCSNYVL